MGRVEKSIEIRAPPERVWEMLAFDNHLEWMDGCKSVEYTSKVYSPKDKYKVGATAHIIEHVTYDLEIIESLENEKMTYRFDVRRISMMVTYILEPIEDGTRFTYALEYEMHWSILDKIIEKLYLRRQIEKETEISLEKLKSILEK